MRLYFVERFVVMKYFIGEVIHHLTIIHALDMVEWIDNYQAIPKISMDFLIFESASQLKHYFGRVYYLQVDQVLLNSIRMASFLQVDCFGLMGEAVL